MGTDAGNNIDADPWFVTPVDPSHAPTTNGNLSLQFISPAINAGDPNTDLSIFPGGPSNPEDLAGNPRVFDGLIQTIDMGAYEFQGNAFGVVVPGDGNIVYVDQNVDTGASGYSASGNSWANAVPELRDALAWAQSWDAADGTIQIWVADGSYLPTDVTTDRTATFQLVNNVEVYGGFAGGEGSLDARDWESSITTLSGDINQSGDLTGNSNSVVTGSGTNNTAVIDGFTITMGNADVASGDANNSNRSGGGMYTSAGSPTVKNNTFTGNSAYVGGGLANTANSSPTVTNSTFSGNTAIFSGGGMSNTTNSSPTITNGTFSGNVAALSAGGMFNDNSSPTVTNSTFSENTANQFNGGGMFNDTSSPTITNSAFSGNTANRGGGMYNSDSSSPTVTNSIFSGNTANVEGGGMYNSQSNPTLTNSIIWGNTSGEIDDDFISTPTVTYSIVQGGYTGTGNLDTDPLFVDPDNGDFTLTEFSPAINAGSNAPFEAGGVAEGITTDLDGNDRIFGDTVDMGAYEFGAEPGVVPGGEDRRVLVSNSVASYTLTGSDLSVDGTVSAVKIVAIPTGGTLLLDGNPVTAPDLPLIIDAGDITGEKLIWSPDADNYGYGYASITFLLVNEFDVESSEDATLYIDVAATSVNLTGSQGWRFMSTPSDGDSYVDLLTGITVDLDFPARQTLYELDQPNYAWDPVASTGDEPGAGTPFIVYVVAEDLPATVTSGSNWNDLDGNYSYSGLNYSTEAPNPDSFYLLGNPHPIALDFCEFTSSNVAVSVSLWDPAANGGNGDYITRSCAVDPDESVPIAPFQAFWVRTTGTNPSLAIPTGAYLTGTTSGFFKQAGQHLIASATTGGAGEQAGPTASASQPDGYTVTLSVSSDDGDFTNTTRL